MTGRTRASLNSAKHVEVRVMLPVEAHEDIASMAKVTGLATSQYVRTLVMTHVAKSYAKTENNK